MANRKASKPKQREASAAMPAFSRRAEFRANSFREDDNTIEIVWSTGAAVRRYDWRSESYYEEVLDMASGSVRLERLNGGAPFLDSHNSWTTRSVIGSIVRGTARIENGLGVARVHLSSAESAADTVQKIRDGDVSNVSVGYIIHRLQKTSPTVEGGLAEWRAIDWEPYEVSAVPIPADAGAHIRSAPKEGEQTFPCIIIDNRQSAVAEKETPMNEEEIAAQEAAARAAAAPAPAAAPVAAPAPVAEVRAAPALDQAAVDRAASEAADKAVRADRARGAEIVAMAVRFGHREFGEQHRDLGTSVDEFRKLLMDHMAAKQQAEQPNIRSVPIGATLHVGEVAPEKRAAAIENAILHRIDPARYDLTDDGRDFRGLDMLGIARDCLEVQGVSTRGLMSDEIAQRALLARGGGGLHSTSDFAAILSNVTNKSLRAAYEEAPQTWRPLVRITSVADFKAKTVVQLGEAPALELVNESGEFKRGTIGEASESYKIATYGKVIGFTRQSLINDDLSAFDRIPVAFGRSAAQLEGDLVWSQILGNPTMGDGTALFHADHKNLLSAADIGVTGISAARLAMAKQVGLDGKTVLNLNTSFLIVPQALLTSAEQFLSPISPAQISHTVPESLRRLGIITDARLDNGINNAGIKVNVNGSAKAWYTAASPSQIDVVEVAYLNGNQGVYTETRTGYDIDGIETKVRLDIGAKTIDWRGLQKNPGE